jgi:hypothetical protein
MKNYPLAPAYYVVAICLVGMVTALFLKPLIGIQPATVKKPTY